VNIYLRELLIALAVGVISALGLLQSRIILLVLAFGLALGGAVWILGLSLRRPRDGYYLLPVLLTLGGVHLAVTPIGGAVASTLAGLLAFLLLYLLYRSLLSRRLEPKADVPLHQNAYLANVWIGSFLALYGLFELSLSGQAHPSLPVLAGALVIYLAAQALAFFFVIAPWEFRRESLVAALLVAEVIFVGSLWATNSFFVAALGMVLLYLFWGLSYHLRKQLLTRRLMYEYGVIAFGLVAFLLVVNRWTGAL
jgi:hypothetical protein